MVFNLPVATCVVSGRKCILTEATVKWNQTRH